MAQMPDYVTLAPGERALALIPQDRQVGLLVEALVSVGVLALLSMGTIGFHVLTGRPATGPSGNVLVSMVFLLGPVVVGRFLRRPQVYVLTTTRVIVAEDHDIPLHQITRMRVWNTRVTIQTGKLRHMLTDLINPPAVAALIRDTVARNRASP
jgi:hypothetical protein